MSDFVSPTPADTSLYLRDFIEKFPLPQVVKVYEGYYDKQQRSTVSADAVYRLISLESVETVLLEDADGQETRIPIDYSCTVERMAEEKFQQRQLGIPELLHEHNSGVKFVRVIESDPNYESLVKVGDKLKIDQKKRKTGETFLPFKNVNDKGKTLWKLPMSCKVKFLALLDGEGLPLAKFVKKNKLPAYVLLTGDNSTKESIDEDIPLPTGVVKLKGTLVESFVKATTEDQDVKTELSFPIMLPISVMAVEMDRSKSPGAKFDSDINEATDEYEDMSGYRAKSDFKSPCLKMPPQRNKETNDKPLAISEFQMSGERVHHGNTYSPPPSMKVARSNSLLGQGKRKSLFQRTLSNLELRTNTTESDENIYDDLNFNYLNAEKLTSRSLSSVPRRKSDSSTEQLSKQKLNNLLQVQAQSLQADDVQGKVETVSLQIQRKSLVYNEPSRKMNTFGRKGTTGGETESVRTDVNALDSILEDQSYSSNPSLSSRLEAKNSPFYGSEEMNLETEPKVLPAFRVPRRSSADVLPPLPKLQEPCPVPRETKGKLSLTANKVQVLPVNNKEIKENLPQPSPRRDKVTIQNRNQKSQLPSSAGIEKDTCVNEGISPICQSQDDTPPPIPSRNKQRDGISSPVSSPTLDVDAPSSRVGQPVPPSREKSGSFRGIEQGNPTMVSSPDGKAPSVSLSPVAMPRSVSASFLEKGNEKEAAATSQQLQGAQTRHVSGENPQTPVSEKAESKFTIPEDLSSLRVTEVLQCLRKLNMHHFEEIFKERQVDGSMLVCLDEEALESFGMDRFYRLKLLRFIAGWRPQL